MNERRWHLLAGCTVSTIGLVIAGMTIGTWWALASKNRGLSMTGIWWTSVSIEIFLCSLTADLSGDGGSWGRETSCRDPRRRYREVELLSDGNDVKLESH